MYYSVAKSYNSIQFNDSNIIIKAYGILGKGKSINSDANLGKCKNLKSHSNTGDQHYLRPFFIKYFSKFYSTSMNNRSND